AVVGKWVSGSIWLRDSASDNLRCSITWHEDAPGLADFAATTKAMVLKAGEGLPGRVMTSHKPIWFENLAADTNFPRAGAATAAQSLCRQRGFRTKSVYERSSRDRADL